MSRGVRFWDRGFFRIEHHHVSCLNDRGDRLIVGDVEGFRGICGIWQCWEEGHNWVDRGNGRAGRTGEFARLSVRGQSPRKALGRVSMVIRRASIKRIKKCSGGKLIEFLNTLQHDLPTVRRTSVFFVTATTPARPDGARSTSGPVVGRAFRC